MLVIRLFRAGKKNQPFFKIVVTDKRRSSKGGRFTEELGFVNPLTKKNKVNAERAKYWISKGAKPSDTIYNLLINEKVIEGKKISVHKKSKKQEEIKPAPSASEAVKPAEEKPKEAAPVQPEVVESPKEEAKPEAPKTEEQKAE
jgi:small subunit ribosomal protein S16